jgi:diguanylate cyclase (GGDEF)-like protein
MGGPATFPAVIRIGVPAVAVLASLAWILASFLVPVFRPGPLLLIGFLIFLGAWTVRKLALVRTELQSANNSLAARVSELATLHSIGREIVSSLDLQKVFLLVERECRKIIDISRFSISLTNPATAHLENVYSHTRGKSGGPGGRVRRIEKWVAVEKRGMRIGRGRDELERRGLPNAGGAGEFPSTLAVPLIVEERVVGVLMVQSVLPAAYDEHHLAVLTTIAQQAAVAIENARHYRMATVDSLTGVSLREYFFRRVKEEHNRASRYHSPFALVMIDLDGFKAINDVHGHQVGDRYLSLLGAVIRSHLRTADLACRYGGDEFCILLPETGFEGARTIAERLRQAIANLNVSTDGEMAATTASIGIAIFPDHGAENLSTLLKHADQALYRAKRRGKDQVLPFAARANRAAARAQGSEFPERNARRAERTVR